MASYAGGRVITQTLSANTVDFVYLSAPGMGVQVTNVSGTAPIYFTVSHPGGNGTVPTVNGQDCFVAASIAGEHEFVRHDGMYGSIVQLISAGTPQYSVEVSSARIPR